MENNYQDNDEVKEPDEIEKSLTILPDFTSPWKYAKQLRNKIKIEYCKSLWDWRYLEDY